MKKTVYIYGRHLQPDGIQIIIKHLKETLLKYNVNVLTVDNLEKIDAETLVIPYGIVPAMEMIKKGFSCKITLMVDAMSLGIFSEFTSWVFRKQIPFKYKMRMFAMFFYYLFLEFTVLLKSKSVILVSEYDKSYLKKRFPCPAKKITVVPNGIIIPQIQNEKQILHSNFILGIITNWDYGVFYDTVLFIEDYFHKLKNQFPDIRLMIAGKGAKQWMIDYWKTKEGIQYTGTVNDIGEFYHSIDAVLITHKKKCGILNKVLEAFAFKKIVLGLPHNFYAFPKLSNAFFTYRNYDSLYQSIQTIKDNPSEVQARIEKAYGYIQKEHSWEINYTVLKNLILNEL